MNKSLLFLLTILLLTIGCVGEHAVIKTATTVSTTTTAQAQITIPTETSSPEISETIRPTQTTTTTTSSTTSTTSTTTTTTSTTKTTQSKELDVVYKKDSSTKPTWLLEKPGGSAPWNGAVYMSTSKDGLLFTNERLFVDRAGVPNLLLTEDEKLIATFQYFSFEHKEMFDVIAYTVSEDFGNTWTKVKKIQFQGLPRIDFIGPNPVDPTLVELEDKSLRLYFTYHSPGEPFPELYSAISNEISTPFINEGPQLRTNSMILDPAVIRYKQDWHHYTVRHGEKKGGKFVNVHSTSMDGKNFELQEDIYLDFQLLGQAIFDKDKIRFYGTGDGVKSATSTDGFTWAMDPGTRANGADPGAARLPDGTYLLIYTKPMG